MRGYGLPRNNDLESPDKMDIKKYGLKGMRQRKKAEFRRIWKKKIRKAFKNEILEECNKMLQREI